MRDLNFAIKQLCLSNQDGSFSTQASRLRSLDLIATQLEDLGFRHLSVGGLKPKHIDALLKLWLSTSISTATIKNRLAHLRWWASKINKPGLVPNSNAKLNIPSRSYVSNTSKAVDLPPQSLDLISDPFVKLSLLLQLAFGLRREEAIKFQPSFADKGNSIILKHSWCKGGQQREIPITNQQQRLVLDQCHSLVASGSLIAPGRSYIQHLKVYESQTRRAGLHNLHGLRHKYAQDRFLQLTGSPSTAALNSLPNNLTNPIANTHTLKSNTSNNNVVTPNTSNSSSNSSNISSKLPPEQKNLHKQARLTISKELGHHRLQVTSVYLGTPLK